MSADAPLAADPRWVMPMSWEEFNAWEDDTPGEYLDGVFVVAPSASVPHAELSARFLMALRPVVTPPYRVLQEVEWTPRSERQAPVPDVSVFWPTIERRAVQTPVLAIEILSSKPHYDLRYKRNLYASWGLPTYWTASPQKAELRVHELTDGELAETARLTSGVHTLGFGPFEVDLDIDALFASL